MLQGKAECQGEPVGKISRRRFLKGAAAYAATAPTLARTGQRQVSSGQHSILAYVGTYSSPQGPEGAVGRGQGIYLFAVDPATGALTQRALFANDANPSWLAFDPSRTHLYSGNEVSNFQGTSSGSVSAYAIDRAHGHLTLLNTVSSEGAGPAHLSVHPSGRYALVANYHGGTVAVLPIRVNGELGPATDVVHDMGAVGPEHAASGPPGSFAISGHDKPHAHMIRPTRRAASCSQATWGSTRFSFGSSMPKRARSLPTTLLRSRCPREMGRVTSPFIPRAAGSIRCRKRAPRW